MVKPLKFDLGDYRWIEFARLDGHGIKITVDNEAGYDTEAVLTAAQAIMIKEWLAGYFIRPPTKPLPSITTEIEKC